MSGPIEPSLPPAVAAAQAALDILRAENPAVAAAVQKILPGYALRRAQRGEEVTAENWPPLPWRARTPSKKFFAAPAAGVTS